MWSVDNEFAEAEAEKESKRRRRSKRMRMRVKKVGKKMMEGRVLVSGAMLMEVETVLQTQVLWK